MYRLFALVACGDDDNTTINYPFHADGINIVGGSCEGDGNDGTLSSAHRMAFQTATSSVYLSSSSRVISLRKSINSRTTMLLLFGDNDDDYDTVSSSKLPYSTTTSNSASSSSPVAAAAAVLSLGSWSSSPF